MSTVIVWPRIEPPEPPPPEPLELPPQAAASAATVSAARPAMSFALDRPITSRPSRACVDRAILRTAPAEYNDRTGGLCRA
jgi:hypothetical protein